jgi:hypothetical protein
MADANQPDRPLKRVRAGTARAGASGTRRRAPDTAATPATPGLPPEEPQHDAAIAAVPRVLIGRGHEGLTLSAEARARLDQLRDHANALAADVLAQHPELGEQLAAYLNGEQLPADTPVDATVNELRSSWWAYVMGLLEAHGVDTDSALRLRLLEVVDAPVDGEQEKGEGEDGTAADQPRRRQQLRLPAIPDAFVDHSALVPSAFPVQGALASIHNAHEGPGGWRRARDGTPYFAFEQQQGRMTVSIRDRLHSVARRSARRRSHASPVDAIPPSE